MFFATWDSQNFGEVRIRSKESSDVGQWRSLKMVGIRVKRTWQSVQTSRQALMSRRVTLKYLYTCMYTSIILYYIYYIYIYIILYILYIYYIIYIIYYTYYIIYILYYIYTQTLQLPIEIYIITCMYIYICTKKRRTWKSPGPPKDPFHPSPGQRCWYRHCSLQFCGRGGTSHRNPQRVTQPPSLGDFVGNWENFDVVLG